MEVHATSMVCILDVRPYIFMYYMPGHPLTEKIGLDVKNNWRAIIHCDKYTPYSLFVTKHTENHVDDLKTMEEDWDTFSIIMHI